MSKIKIAPEELKEILKNHEEWLQSGGRRGIKADLPGAGRLWVLLYGVNLCEISRDS